MAKGQPGQMLPERQELLRLEKVALVAGMVEQTLLELVVYMVEVPLCTLLVVTVQFELFGELDDHSRITPLD